VPFFVIDRRYGISGAQPAETFLQALRTAYASETAPPRTGAAPR
jgi:predicted DsbA family dithiol-disulfide isomerase